MAATPRRAVAIKHNDGEPLTRADIQYDFLHAIFSDTHAVFTDPFAPKGAPKVTFKDLYVNAICSSKRATKGLKDKIRESPEFMEDFAMLALLVNIGRVNTTMSFFPEMKTAIRTYHPIPVLQRTNGNMQDAPRIKHILKSIATPLEEKLGYGGAPDDLTNRCRAGSHPPSNITNLMFVFSYHHAKIGKSHFNGVLDFFDLFLRQDVSSASRSRAFLWLCHNYLEAPAIDENDYDDAPSPNPFGDPENEFALPRFCFLTPEEAAEENKESPEDLLLAEKLLAQRNQILTSHATNSKDTNKGSTIASTNGSIAGDGDETSMPVHEEETKGKRKRGGGVSLKVSAQGKRGGVKEKKTAPAPAPTPAEKVKERDFVFTLEDDDQVLDAFIKQQHSLHRMHRSLTPHTVSQSSNHFDAYEVLHRHSYAPYPQSQIKPLSPGTLRHSRHRTGSQAPSIFQQAFQRIDIDSDEEVGDEYTRDDYIQRYQVISQLAPQNWIPSRFTEMEVDPI